MTETFFIGDTHFGHKSIIKFEPIARPFSGLEEMHEVIIERWNKAVHPKHRVFVLGDFCFGKKWLPLAGRLNGLKYLIAGNHDNLSTAEYLKYFHKVSGAMEFDGCVMTHIPVHPEQFLRYRANIHGHLHSKLVDWFSPVTLEIKVDERYINVSCEQNGLVPIPYSQIQARLAEDRL
jgi:calcineurin-like phosphoesterase family protein